MNDPSVYIIILNWNGWEDTVECISSINKSDYTNYKVVLLDNYSENDSVLKLKAWIRDNYKIKEVSLKFENSIIIQNSEEIIFILNSDNLGFAKANNIGIRYSIESGADFVILLNNDTIAEKETISSLINFKLNNPQYSALIPQIRYYEPANIVWNCGGKLMPLYGGRRYYYCNKSFEKVPQSGFMNISFMTGCALFLDYKRTGLLSEDFFFGEEDFELSLRMRKSKLKAACVFNSVIYHKVGRSINLNTNSIGKNYIYYLNRFIDLRKQWSAVRWHSWRIFYIFYILALLFFKYGLSPQILYKFTRKLFNNSSRLSKVTKEHFEESLGLSST